MEREPDSKPDRTDFGAVVPAAGRPAAGPLTGEARRRLGRNLRMLYAGVLDQPLPERLTRLVEDLAARSEEPAGAGRGCTEASAPAPLQNADREGPR